MHTTTTPTSPTTRHDDSFDAPDTRGSPGVRYHRITIRPTDPARVVARLAVLHGYGDHAGRYAEAMTWWAARGVACQAIDLRGHGTSSGRRAYVRRWDEYLADLDMLLHSASSRDASRNDASSAGQRSESRGDAPATPMFLFGHSHGGLIAAAAGVRGRLGPHRVAGVILSAPYLVNGVRVPAHKSLAARVANAICPWLLIPSGLTPEMMSSDPAMVEDARRDPLLLRRATPRWYLAHRPVQAGTLANAARFTLPLLVLQGDADAVADPRGTQAFHASAQSADKTLVTYPGFRHEPLRERGRERVFADVFEWVARRAGDARPSAGGAAAASAAHNGDTIGQPATY